MQIKRNETIFETLADAKNGLKVPAGVVSDGDIIVSRYATGSVLGVVRVDQQTDVQTWTIYDTDSRIKYDDGSRTLPDGYTEVEYISNSSTAYITTNYYANQDTRFVGEFQADVINNNPRMFGAGPYNSTAFIGNIENGNPPKYYFKYGYTSSWIQTSSQADTNKHKFDLNKNQYYIDDVLVATATVNTFTMTYYLGIFNAPSNIFTTNECFKGKCYYAQVYDDDTLVLDLIPCKRDSDSKAGMYDIVNDVFYTSSTSATFTAGPEV